MKIFLLNKVLKCEDGMTRDLQQSHEKIDLHCFSSFKLLAKSTRKETPDILILNVDCPNQDALRLSEEIKSDSILLFIPIIFIVPSSTTNEEIDQIVNSGSNLVLKRPIRKDDLYAHLRVLSQKKDFLERKAKDYEFVQRDLSFKTNILESRGKKYKSIFDQSPIGILLYDENGRVIDYNKQALTIFGISDEVMKDNLDFIKYPGISDDIRNKLLNHQEIKYYCDYDFEQVHRDKLYTTPKTGKIHFSVRISPIAI